MKKIWIIWWHTESNDKGVLGYFTKKPTEAQQLKLKKKYFQEEFDEERHTCFVYFEVIELKEEKL
jgi:hypothetical protein